VLQETQTLYDALVREVARHYHMVVLEGPKGSRGCQHWDDSFAAVLLAQQQNITALMAALQVLVQFFLLPSAVSVESQQGFIAYQISLNH
jgi:hypothetical protein